MRSFSIALVVAASLLSTAFAEAGLQPTKASQLVTLGAILGCPIAGHPNAVVLQLRVGGDGSSSVLVIPPKQVLVLTDIEMTTRYQVPGHVFLGSVYVGSAAQSQLVAYRFTTIDTSGAIAIRFTPENGIVVKPGSVACIELTDSDAPAGVTGTVGYAHGFLAPDK